MAGRWSAKSDADAASDQVNAQPGGTDPLILAGLAALALPSLLAIFRREQG